MCQLLADFFYSLCSIAGNQIKSPKIPTFLRSFNGSSPLTCGQAYPPSPGTQRSPAGLTNSCFPLCTMTLLASLLAIPSFSAHFHSAPLLRLLCESWMSLPCSPPTHYFLILQARASLWRLPEWILFCTDPAPPPPLCLHPRKPEVLKLYHAMESPTDLLNADSWARPWMFWFRSIFNNHPQESLMWWRKSHLGSPTN